MRWPWVSRNRLRFAEAEERIALRRAVAAETRVHFLEETLKKCDEERRETHLRLLRHISGIPIFPDQQVTPVKEATAEETITALNFQDMTEQEIDHELARMATRTGCRTMPAIQRFVETNKRRIFGEQQQAAYSAEDAALREQALRSFEQAGAEGRAAAVRTN